MKDINSLINKIQDQDSRNVRGGSGTTKKVLEKIVENLEQLNEAGFVTKDVDDLENYNTKTQEAEIYATKQQLGGYYTKEQTDAMLATLGNGSYVVAWDGSSEPVVANIPAGVTVTYDGTDYTGTLDASASTKENIYLVGQDMYITSVNDSTYSWLAAGTTELDLSGYATDAELSQLEAKVTGLDAIKANAEIGGWDITSTDYYRVDNANRVSIGPFRLNAGDKIILSDYSVCRMYIGWKTEDGTNGSSGGWKTADYTVPVSGLYVVTLEGIPAFAVSNTSDLTQYFSIITSSTEADKNTEDVFVLEDAKLNKAVGTNILRSDMPFVANCLLSNTGALTTHSSYSAYKTTKDFIPVSPSTTYARASEGYQYKKICYYDKGLRFLSYEAEKNTFTTPANTAFVRITFYASYGYDMVCKSSSTKPYEPYSEASGYIDGPLKDLREELYNNISSAYPTKWGKVPFIKTAVSTYAITGVELVLGHKYRVRIVTSPTLTAPSIMTLKVASATSDTSLANVAQLGGQTISDTSVDFIWELSSGKNFRLGFYAGAVSQEIEVYIQDITVDVVASETSWDIIARNRHKESALISVVAHGGTDNIKVADKLSLLHLSDLHGNTTKLSAVVKYRDFYEDYLDDTIHTGDSVMNYITDEDPFVVVDGAETILNVIGNHEAWNQGESDYNATEKETYDKIFAPSIANWDVTQPTNASANGYCYYYKDYSPAGFRLIVLDSVHWHYRNGVAQTNPAQKSWFESVLADAITQNLRVVCATHYTPQNGIVPVENTGFNVFGTTPGSAIADGWYAVDEIFGCVDAFINNGGKFAGWLMGHTHNDFFGTVYGHTGQPVVVMGTSGMLSPNNKFVNGTASQDNFNIVTFENWNSKNIIKIVKIGQDTDLYLRSKKTICYNFTDGVLVSTT